MNDLDDEAGLKIRDAGFLDIPYIFSMITNASLNDGVFSETVLTSRGYASLLKSLFASLHVFRFLQKRKGIREDLLIMEVADESIGFLHCIDSLTMAGKPRTHLEKCGIALEHRRKGIGTKMIHWMIARASVGERLITVHCNRNARAMQHILKRNGFARSSIGRGIEFYELQAPSNQKGDVK
jgi:GNAT superfamily N-acetyltransferase